MNVYSTCMYLFYKGAYMYREVIGRQFCIREMQARLNSTTNQSATLPACSLLSTPVSYVTVGNTVAGWMVHGQEGVDTFTLDAGLQTEDN